MKNDELLNKIKKLEEENYSLKEKLSILEQASSIKPQTDESIKITEEFFNSEDFGVQVFDKNGFSIKMNLKQQEILGLSSNDIGIGTFNVLTDPYSIMNGASELYKKAYSGEIISHTFEYNLNISENSWDTKKEKIILLETIIPIPGKSSKVENVVSILFDITDKSLLESLINNTKSKYESLVENIPAIIYMFSLNKGGVFYSSQVKNILGYSKEHLYANPMLWNQSIHPDDKPLISKAFEDFQKGLGFNVQYRIKNSKGDWLWFEDRLINSLDKSGEQIIEGVAIDITERKKAEELLKRSESISTSIIKSLNEGIIIRDKSNKIILHNDAAKSILGSRILKDLDNLNPNLHYKFINESGENYHLDELPAIFTLKTGKPVVDKVLGVKNENLIKWFKVNTIPIFENDETTPSMVVA
ncbi:MAG: PAS domain S-box protein, partial [Leptospiraceae bacterium]|nr:PAS domain S-box protein [Leptospiraceae bacterium]